MTYILTTTLISLLLSFVLAVPYVKYSHALETGARCLDGTPAAIYVAEGDKNNILIYFNSGGFCEGETLSATIESCYKRSDTNLGSSKKYNDTVDYDSKGILSTLPEVNPHFWNWTKVYVPYCDGSLHQGSRLQPITYKDKSLYFRGSNNTLQHFDFLDRNYNLYKADKIVITGISAGGMATYFWSNYLYDRSASKNVYAFPDSGLFISTFVNPYTGKTTLMDNTLPIISIVNTQTRMPIENCMQELKNDTQCFLFYRHAQFQKAPMFIIQSQYDEFSIQNILTLKCQSKRNYGAYSLQTCNDTQISHIQSYKKITLQALSNFSTKLTNFGMWAPACVQHGFSQDTQSFAGPDYKIPSGTGITLSDAMIRFINNISDKQGNTHIDSVSWPQNSGCSGKTSFSFKQKLLRRINQIIY